jgi:outer membrane protein
MQFPYNHPSTERPWQRRRRPLFLTAVASLVAAIVMPLLCTPAAQAESLEEALAAAYGSNPTLLAQRAALRATNENVSQSLAGWRPTISSSATVGHKRVHTGTVSDVSLGQRSYSLSVSQPLYRGGRTVASTAQTESFVMAGRAQLSVVEQNILLSVASNYMNVLRDQAVLDLNKHNVEVLRKQLEATKDRFEVGEITRTDVAQAEARLSGAISQRVQAGGNLKVTQAGYASVVGNMPGSLTKPAPLTGMPAAEKIAQELSLENNPSLQVAVHSEEASMHDIDGTRGSLLPTVSLSGDLAHADDASARGGRSSTGFLGVTVSVPLYQAGGVYSQLRQSRQLNSQAKIEVEETRRSVQQQVTQSWERWTTSTAAKDARQDQVRAASIALEGVRQELAVGSRTTLDVLDSEQELLDARVALVSAETDEAIAAFDLVAAMGGLTAEALGLNVALYNPAADYDKIRDKWFGADSE